MGLNPAGPTAPPAAPLLRECDLKHVHEIVEIEPHGRSLLSFLSLEREMLLLPGLPNCVHHSAAADREREM